MTDPDGPAAETPTDADALRADIERARAELAETMDALTHKLNVKEQASDRAAAAKDAAKEKVAAAASSAKAATPHRGKIFAGVGAGLLVLLVVRRRSRAKRNRKPIVSAAESAAKAALGAKAASGAATVGKKAAKKAATAGRTGK